MKEDLTEGWRGKVHWFRAFAAPSEDPGSVSGIHIRGVLMPSSVLHRYCTHVTYTEQQAHTHQFERRRRKGSKRVSFSPTEPTTVVLLNG